MQNSTKSASSKITPLALVKVLSFSFQVKRRTIPSASTQRYYSRNLTSNQPYYKWYYLSMQ
nr:MAG TPA: hypothetical protein [Caudoviricetes sp.]